MGMYGSVVDYKQRLLWPRGLGADHPTAKLFERRNANAAAVSGAQGATAPGPTPPYNPKPPPPCRSVNLTGETWLQPWSEHLVEVAMFPPLQSVPEYDALVTPLQSQLGESLRNQGVRIAPTLVKAAPGRPIWLKVCNMSGVPVQLKKHTYLGMAEPTTNDNILDLHGDVEQLRAELNRRLLQHTAQHGPTPEARRAATEALLTEELHTDPQTAERTPAPRSTVFTAQAVADAVADAQGTPRAEHAPLHPSYQKVTDLCGEEQFRQMLTVEVEEGGETKRVLNPMLTERAPDGRVWADHLMDVLSEYSIIFPKDPKNPHVTARAVFDVDTGDAAPIADRVRRWSRVEADYIIDWVKQMHARGQVEPGKGPWACNPVLAYQKDKIRFCVDFRKLNAVTKRDSHGIGNIDDLLHTVQGALVVSTLDMAAGYHQVPLAEEAKPKTAFYTPDGGLWQYTVSPFGLVNLPSQFTRMMHSALGDALGRHAHVYVDDVIVHSRSMAAHIAHLRDVFARVREAGLSVSWKKCQLFRPEVKFLGHIVGAGGTRPDPDKVKAIAD
jgi:hypothetical protein